MQKIEVETLLGQLTEPSWMQRRKVVMALARAGNDAIGGLREVLTRTRDDETRIASAVEALVASTGDVDDAMLRLVNDETPAAVLCDVAVVLGRRRSKRGVPALEKLCDNPDSNVALAAIEALGRVGGGAGVATLMEIVTKRDFFRTFPAIEVLGRSHDTRALPLLLDLLADQLYALPAARAIGESADPRGIEGLVNALFLGDDGLVRACAVALGQIAAQHPERFRAPLARLRGNAGEAAELAKVSWQNADTQERASLAYLLGLIGGQAAIDALLAVTRSDDDISVAIADAFATLGRAADEALLQIIATGTSTQRRLLLPVLHTLPGGAGPVVASLHDSDPEVRSAAADALARFGGEDAIDALFQGLHDAHVAVVQSCVAAIQALKSARIETLALTAANDPDRRVRRAALRIISHFAWPSGIEALLRGAVDEDDRIRETALAGLPAATHVPSRQAVVAAAHHPAASTRAAAVRALAQVPPDTEVENTLSAALSDPEGWVRYYACLSIGALRLGHLTDAVIALLTDPVGQVPLAAIEALGHLRGAAALAALDRAARSSNIDVQRAALVGLGLVRDQQAVSILLAHVETAEPAVRVVALTALANYEGPAVVKALRTGALDADWTVRQVAIGALAARSDTASLQTLIELLDQRLVLDLVMHALASHEKNIPHLAAALNQAGQDRSVALATTLSRIPRREAERSLVEALRAPNAFARRAVATVLSGVRSPEVLAALDRAAKEDVDAEVRDRALQALAV